MFQREIIMGNRVLKALACLAFSVCLFTTGCELDAISEEVIQAMKDGVEAAVIDAGCTAIEAAVEPWFD